MSTNIVYNGVTYTIPATDDVAWGDAVSNFLIAIPDGMLTKVGGAWALTGSDLDLGAAYGISAIYLKTKTATPALAGVLRLAFNDAVAWRSTANDKDLVLKPDASNFITWDNVALVDISTVQTVTNKTINAPDNTITNIKDVNIAADAAIAYSKLLVADSEIAYAKLSLTGMITNADIAADAAISASKIDGDFGPTEIITAGGLSLGTTYHVTLIGDPSEDYDFEFPDTDGSTGQALVKSSTGKLQWSSVPGLALDQYNVLVGDSSDLPVPVDTNALGDVAATSVGGFTIKALAITDAMISASAAIAFSKMAGLTASRALVSDGSGVVSVASTTAAEIGYVSGVTSAIQTQLTAKVVGPASAVDSNFAAFDTTTGKLLKDSGSKAADFATAASVAPLTAAVTATTEPTGFEDCANVVVTYDSGAQTITLTHSSGTIYYWVSGVRLSLSSPWTSDPHTNTLDAKYWLSLSGAGASVWTTNASPGFDKCLVANCVYYTAYKFAIREVHGLMPHTAHKEFHNVVGTYRGSGGSAVSASYAALTNTIAAVTPDVDEAVINDEDLPTTVLAFAAAEGYTQLYFDTNAATFVTGAALPYIVTGTASAGNPRYNQNPISGTALTNITTNNRWFNVYTIFVPVTADAASQAYRMLWLTGQQVYTTLSAAQSEDFRTVALGNLQTLFGEFLPYIRWSFIKTNSNNTYNTQVAATPTYLLGTAAQLVSVSGFNPVDHNALTGRSDADSHPASAITGTAVTLAGAETLTNKYYDGGTASANNKLKLPSDTYANLVSLAGKAEGQLYYATDTDKVYYFDGTDLKVTGGGLLTVYKAFADGDFTAEPGKHYIVDMAGANALRTITLPTGAAESVVRVTCINNDSTTYPLTIARGSTDTIFYNDAENTSVNFPFAEQWAEVSYTVTGTHWVVNDGSTPLSGTFSGSLTVTGPFTPSGGIVGKTDGVAVAAGYVGEVKLASRDFTNRTGLTNNTDINITSLTLGAGIWDIYVSAGIDVASTTPSYFIIGLSKTSATQPATGTINIPSSGEMKAAEYFPSGYAMSAGLKTYSLGPVRNNLSASTTFYLVVSASWASGAGNGLGSITAVRIA